MRTARTLLLLFSMLLLTLAACSERPIDPSYENPFDPNGPDGGDPFQLSAVISGSQVLLRWQQVDHPEVAGYRILHSLSPGGPFDDTLLTPLLPSSPDGPALAFHSDYAPGVSNYYKVQAITATGRVSSLSSVVAAQILPPPYLRLADDATATPTREVQLRTRSDVGESVEIAGNAEFVDAVPYAIVAGEELTVDWQLPLASANGETLKVYVRALLDGGASETGRADLLVDFTPAFGVVGNAAAIVDPDVEFNVAVAGVVSLRLASSAEALADAPWQDPAERIPYQLSTEIPEEQEVWAEFLGDFGFPDTSHVVLKPVSELPSASFTLNGGDSLTTTREVLLVSQAPGALDMRFSESPDFSGAPVLAYADSTTFTLSPEPGPKTVYGWYSNPWDPDGQVAVDSVTLIGDPGR